MASRGDYKLNVRFLGRLLILVVVFSVAVFAVHYYQEKRLIDRYLTQADQARDGNDHRRELDYLKTYIALKPTDNASRLRYGRVLAKYSRSPLETQEAYFVLQKALQNDPNPPAEVRLECAKLAVRWEIDSPSEARRELETLLKASPNNEEYELYYADALWASKELALADQRLTKITSTNKHRVDAFWRLAWLRKERDKNEGAAEFVIGDMVKYNPTDPKAHLYAAYFYKNDKQFAKCDQAIAEARKLAPKDPEVLSAAADRLLAKWKEAIPMGTQPKATSEFEDALTLLQQGLGEIGPLPAVDPLPDQGSPDMRKLQIAVVIYQLITKSLTLVERYDAAEKYAREEVAKLPHIPALKLDLLEVLVRQKKYEEAKALCTDMERKGFPRSIVEMQRGFMAFEQKQYVEAADHLERTVTEVAPKPELRMKASLMLAFALTETNELDRLMVAIRDAVPSDVLDPNWAAIKMIYADTLDRLGRHQEAIAVYKEVEKEPRSVVPMVRSLIVERASLKSTGANDAEIERRLKRIPDGKQKDILTAQYLTAKKDVPAARALLDKAIERNPAAGELYPARFQLEIFEKQFTGAKEVIDRAEAKLGDNYEVRLMKVTLFLVASKGEPSTAPELEALAVGLDKFKPEERQHLLKMLSLAGRTIARRDLARQWLLLLVKERGDHDMNLQYMLLDLALLDGDDVLSLKVLEKIASISNGKDNPSYKIAEAFYLIYKAGRTKDQAAEKERLLNKAMELLNGLESTRKEWGRLYLAQGKVADMLGKNDVAIDKFILAVEKGERQPEVLTRLFELCYSAKKIELWVNLTKTIPEAGNFKGGGEERQIPSLLENGELKRAIELVHKFVPDDCTDPSKLLYLGQILLRCNDPAGAETALRKAQLLAPSNGDILLTLLHVLWKRDKKDEARRFLEENKNKIAPADAALAQAQAYYLTEDYAKSRELYKDLVEKRPNELLVLKLAGTFFFRTGDFAIAGPLMVRIIQHRESMPNDKDYARRTLALCTVVNRDHKGGVRALGILGYKTPTEAATFNGTETIDELRSRFAVVSVIKGREARLASTTILNEIERRFKELSTDEQLALGQIYFALGEIPEAQRRLLQAASAREGFPVAVAVYANFLLLQNHLDLAKKQIDLLLAQQPNSLVTVQLAAHWAVLSKKKAEAVEYVKRYAATKDAIPEVAASILEQLGLPDDAESFYRRALESGRLETHLVYAGYLARRGKPVEAMAEFRSVWDQVPKDKAVPMLCQAMMHANQANAPAVVSQAGEMIRAACAEKPELRPFLAAYLSLTDQVPEAITLSRLILTMDPENTTTLNNLANLLSLKDGNHPEAAATIRKAIEIAGPQPQYLDTEAVCLIAAGHPNDAIEKLKEVLVDAPSATAYMHLAQAYLAIGKRSEAGLAVRDARKLNVRLDEFHPLERNAIRALLTQFPE